MPNPSTSSANAILPPDIIVRGKRVVMPDGERAAAIHVRGGTIAAISDFGDVPTGCPVHEAGDSVVMPGIVDTHVHINEPGRTDWEGFSTATHAAAAGGVTTIIEMPLNSIPATTSASALREKIAASAGKLWVDVGFWGGLVPGNVSELKPLWEGGAFGYKCFLVPSGVDEFPGVAESDLRSALPELVSLHAPLLAHAEIPGPIDAALATVSSAGFTRQVCDVAGRASSRAAEDEALALLLRLSREFGARIHIVHLSSSDSLPQLKEAKAAGLPVSVETCPHYLTFAAEEIADGATEFKCAPPIREAKNREALWAGLGDGTIDFIATDHSPCPPDMKQQQTGDFMKAWGGVASLQLSLPVVWTEAHARGYSVSRIAEWLCSAPARLAGVSERKGEIAVGADADFAIWDPDAKFRVEAVKLHHRHKLTPYIGRELAGVVESTFLRGRKIFHHGELSTAPTGLVLRRGLS